MPLTKSQKEEFNKQLTEFKNYIEELKKEVNLYKLSMKKCRPVELPYYQIAIVLNSIRLMNTCLNINSLSLHILGLKSENYLNIARKEMYSVISNMEKVVGANFENGLDENRELLDAIVEFNPLQRLNFLKALRRTLNDIIDAYESGSKSGSKWKWSFPELHFKLAVLSKNLFDFRAYERENSLDNPYYYTRKEHFDLIIELSNVAAQEYRAKYDLATNDVGDLKKCIQILEMLRKIFQITGNHDELAKVKNLIESMNAKIASAEEDKKKKKKK
ncbi:MAG: hypothetical protein N3A69_07490 [Leptospiraceae bacterium]|nr:hypothetical protein [Leptospiraceae bacterium]